MVPSGHDPGVQALQGDLAAASTAPASRRFRAMVDGYFDFVWRSLRGLGVPSGDADDAAQQVFLVAVRKLGSITPGSERSFLFGTAIGVAANARRGRSRRREVGDDEGLDAHPDAAPDAEEQLRRKQARARLDAILGEMPLELRTVFVLFELESLTMAEIARMLDLPPGTVASRLRRARENFREGAARAGGGDQ